MLISSINTSAYTYAPATVNTLDSTGKLFAAKAPSPTLLGDNNGMATADVFIYSRMGMTSGDSAPSRGVVLENADGSYFKLDLTGNEEVNLVAKGGNLQLFVYRPDSTSAEKFVFDRKGVFSSTSTLDVESFSAAEVATRRDLDGNGSVGAKLLTTQTLAANDPITTGVSKATGGVFNVNVMGQDIYVVGSRVDRLKRIDASTITLKNGDGTFWKPPAEIQTLRAVSTTGMSGTRWDIYGTASEDTTGDGFAVTTKFSFGTNNQLSSTSQLSAEEVIAAEVDAKKDLNVDGAYGLKITSTIDSAGGLVKGKLAGQDVLLAKVASTDTTGGRAVSLNDFMLDVDGSAWKLPAAATTATYTIQSIVKNSGASSTASVYATKSGGNDALRFDFTLNADNRYEIDETTAAGVTVTAQEMAAAERTQKRDLNGDSKFGATIDSLEDKQTKLYKATMMGKEFYLAGDLDNSARVTARSASAAQSLGGALLNTDGKAWEAKVGSTTYTVNAMINRVITPGNREYDVYAKSGTDVRKFVFKENADGNFAIKADKPNGEVLNDPIALAALEKSSKRDLNGDTKFGATIDTQIDTAVGLYKASIGTDIFYLAGQDPVTTETRTTGLTGALAQDLSGALLNEDGTAWALPSAASAYALKSIVDTTSGGSTSYSIFATKNNGDDVLRFDFEENAAGNLEVSSDSRAGVKVTASDMAAAEDLHNRDLNQDDLYGADISSTIIDRTAGLYTASLMGQDFYLAGHDSGGALRKTATNGTDAKALTGVLLNADGSAWDVKTGYVASSLVKESATEYALYAYKTGDKSDVIRFDFEDDGDGNFVVSDDSIPGIAMSSDAMALTEANLKRDLNSDGAFGVQLSNTLDATGGLYKVSALGGSFLLAGDINQQASANAPLDLSKALLDNDDNAWLPENVADVTANKLSLVPTNTAGTFTIYVENDPAADSDFSAYDFVGYKQSGNRKDLSTEDIANIEETKGRDISGDEKYGAVITDGIDLVGGLYKGSLGSHVDVSFKAGPGLALGSLVAGDALDFSSALKTASGYWKADTGFTAQTGFSDGTDFVVIATNSSKEVRRYTFDTTKDNQIDLAKSGLMTDLEVADLEKTEGRDLNKDKVISVRVDTTALDSVGGLFKGNNGQNDYIIVSPTAAGVTDLSTALLNTDGTRWNPGSFDRLVLNEKTDGGATTGYEVYAKATSGSATTYKRYSFDTDFKLTSTSAALGDLEVGLAEVSIGNGGRDINGDNAIGAKVTEVLHRNSGLYKGEVNDTDMVLLAHNSSGVANTAVAGASAIEGRALYGLDGKTPWDPSGFTLKKATFNLEGGSVSSIYVFAEKAADNTFHRFMFTADHVLVKSEAVSSEQAAASAMANNPAGSYVDTEGGLFKATVLGQDFYVVGDTDGTEDPVPDLSKAMFDGDGNVWKPGTDYKVGGMITNEDGSGDPVTYDVYTFKMGTGANANQVNSVQKSTWDADMNFMGTTEADPAKLAELEKTKQRDLSGDSVVGFKVKTLDTALGYKGVTGATMVNGATYLLAGQDLSTGSSTTALGLNNVLLNAEGSAPWMPSGTEKVKFVDERTASDATRYVYSIDDSSAVETAKRYEFNKTTGKLVGSGEAISLFELAKLEETKNTDINDDNYVGAVTVSVYRDDNADPSPSYGTDLLRADFGGASFLIVNEATTGAGKLTMSGALLNQDGTAWTLPASFTLKGVYQQDGPTDGLTSKPLELYGLDATGAIKQYRFAANVDQFGARTTGYTLMDAKVNADLKVNPIRGSALAATELSAELDLNGDGGIGYLKGSTVVRADSGNAANSWTLGKASVSNGSGAAADEIYVVSEDFEATSSISKSSDTISDNTVASGALWATGGDTYWKPDAGYTVKSVLSSAAGQVEVWAQGTTSDGSKVYQQYVFDSSGGKWEASASSLTADADYDGDTTMDSLSSATMLSEEVTATRDLNGDGAVGLKVMDRISGTGTNAYEAVVDGVSYYVVGDDTTVATGTASAPADPSTLHILKNSDDTLWAPTGAVTDIRLATAADITTEADAAYTVVDGGTDVYFDSSFKKL
ncbi:hypothetical protein [Limnohabitans sp.]|uniref:hypothetical protein n=1 Tax=Limnohabitans sp. TaxID=1907725 RepID=UPI0039BD31C0|nr:hypothetical protein [Comamonadaceae bacterium]